MALGTEKLNKKRILELLQEIDSQLDLYFDEPYVEIGIVGGASFILRESSNRDVTFDIDSFNIIRKEDGTSLRRIEGILQAISDKNNYNYTQFFNSDALMFCGIVEYEENWEEIFVGEFNRVRAFIPSLEMSVALKIASFGGRASDNDYLDVFNEKVISNLDFEKLDKIWDIWLDYVGRDNNQFKWGMENFKNELERFKS